MQCIFCVNLGQEATHNPGPNIQDALQYDQSPQSRFPLDLAPIRLINSTASHCWFTAALVSLIYARRVSQTIRPPPTIKSSKFPGWF